VLEDLGFRLKHVTGSHHIFGHVALADRFSLPFQKPHVNSVYVKQFLELVKQLAETTTDENDADE
jgi:predicted RNA binding protein YcfA (HicA-like mRNA interferase family)